MLGVHVTIKKNVHVDTYAPQAIARFLHQGGLLQKSASTSWQLFTQIRHFITQF